jgi:hypothetical protein
LPSLQHSTWVPRLIIVAGIGCMMAVTSCYTFPTIPVGAAHPYTPPPTPSDGITPSPTATILPSASPDAGATQAASPAPAIAPAVGRKYTLSQTGSNPATIVIDVVTLAGDKGTYNTTTTVGSAAPVVQQGLAASKQNGVYWLGQGQSPVTKDITSYPVEQITTKAGTFMASKVTSADGTLFWFAQGVEIKSTNSAGVTELVAVQ